MDGQLVNFFSQRTFTNKSIGRCFSVSFFLNWTDTSALLLLCCFAHLCPFHGIYRKKTITIDLRVKFTLTINSLRYSTETRCVNRWENNLALSWLYSRLSLTKQLHSASGEHKGMTQALNVSQSAALHLMPLWAESRLCYAQEALMLLHCVPQGILCYEDKQKTNATRSVAKNFYRKKSFFLCKPKLHMNWPQISKVVIWSTGIIKRYQVCKLISF